MRIDWEVALCFRADLHRLENRFDVERLDAAEMVGSQATWNNSGKF